MRLLRGIGLFIAGLVFRGMLLLAVAATATVVIAGNSKHVKSALDATKAYERFVPAVMKSYSAQSQSSESIPLNDPQIQQIASNAFPPDLLKTNAEMVVDSFYKWLNGKTVAPAFRVDLTDNKQKLAEDLGNHAIIRLSGKPVCTVLPAQINPFTADCQPAGFDPAFQTQPLIDQITHSPGLLPKTVFTAQDLPKVRSGKVLFEHYNYAPKLYRWLLWSPWICGLLLLLSGASLVLLNRNKQIGMYRAGFEILSNGVLFMVSPILFGYIVPSITKNVELPETSVAGVQIIMNDVFRYYLGYFDNFFINAGIYFSLAGLLIILGAKAVRVYSGYHSVEEKSGLVNSNASHVKRRGKEILTFSSVPIQSSEGSVVHHTNKRDSDRKYRTIPTKEM